jgi:hypothetical protein
LKAPRGLPGAQHAAQYFARHAEPEAALAEDVGESYLAALCVPVCGEESSFLQGFDAALRQAPGRVLLILVVNAPEGAAAHLHAENQRLLAQLAASSAEQRVLCPGQRRTHAVLARAGQHDRLWLDRASVGARLPAREGVGTARKIAGDLAAALWARGQLACSRIASSDGDVTLPADYFTTLTADVVESQPSAAWLWPFQHDAGGDSAIDAATLLYEISLRYYVLGLAAAGSSYAYHSVGSTLCVEAPAYLSVRGFPRREAGEDFYLLDKLAKVAPLRRVAAAPVRIRARASDRVPFGTGRRSREIAEETAQGGEFALYAPRTFDALAAVLRGLDEYAESARIDALKRSVASAVPELAEAVLQVLESLGAFAALASAATQAPTGAVLRRRIHTWFDALRTLRFIHGLRDRCLPVLPWQLALSTASFLREPFAAGQEPAAVCRQLALAEEAELPRQIGPALR